MGPGQHILPAGVAPYHSNTLGDAEVEVGLTKVDFLLSHVLPPSSAPPLADKGGGPSQAAGTMALERSARPRSSLTRREPSRRR